MGIAFNLLDIIPHTNAQSSESFNQFPKQEYKHELLPVTVALNDQALAIDQN